MLPIGEPQSSLYGPGLSGAVSVRRAIFPWMLVGAQARTGMLFDGSAPDDPGREDPGIGTFTTFSAALRFRPIITSGDPARGTSLWIEGAAGGGITGDLGRAALEVGLGYSFAIGEYGLGPFVRYIHFIQPSNELDGRDAQLIVFGAEGTFFDRRPAPGDIVGDKRVGDRDADGILDPDDACPNDAEDVDGFQDEDGCPEWDNDKDGVADLDDGCPLEPEDIDEFEDEDGCPDTDNDQDGILDVSDACPNEPEVVNGVDDEDGCPDEGLIELIDDRIVLEERVLFDFERARVKSAARPIIRAIVNLYRQHPEWARVRIEGHADVRGNEDYNQRLSERRARNVMKFLISEGIPENVIDSRGYGSTQPRSSEETEQAHQLNRRVEFVVLARRPIAPEGPAPAPDMVFDADPDASQPADDAADSGTRGSSKAGSGPAKPKRPNQTGAEEGAQ